MEIKFKIKIVRREKGEKHSRNTLMYNENMHFGIEIL